MIHGSCEVFHLQCGDFELGKTVKTFWSIARIILPDTDHGNILFRQQQLLQALNSITLNMLQFN